MFGALDTSTSGLVAQRTRMDTIAANLANSSTVTTDGVTNSPFQRRIALMTTGDGRGNQDGVHVAEIMLDPAPFRQRYQPSHPMANDDGYVSYPNIDSIVEQINALEAARSYEANITAAEATKRMMQSSLSLLS